MNWVVWEEILNTDLNLSKTQMRLKMRNRSWTIINRRLYFSFCFLFLFFYFLFPAYIKASDLEKDISISDNTKNNENNPPQRPFVKGGLGGLSEKIKTIEVEGLTRIKQEELIDMISFHIGDVIDKEILRDGIKRAFKKGIFLDIRAVTEPNDSGIKLRYIVKEIPVIDKINIEGNEKISKGEIKKKAQKFKKFLSLFLFYKSAYSTINL